MANDMSAEQTAERFLRMKGIKKPDQPVVAVPPPGGGFLNKVTEAFKGKAAPESPQANDQLVTEAYDIIVEKEDLRGSIVTQQREVMEPTGNAPLTLDQKRALIRQGKTGFLLSNAATEPFKEVVGRSQTRINEIDERMGSNFSDSRGF